MNINGKISFKDEYKNGYPLVNLKPEHFNIQDGFTFSTAIFRRPAGNEKSGIAKITLVNQYGDLVEQELLLTFQFSESQRIIRALDSKSFKLRDSALQLEHPRKISDVDFINIFEDVEILNVTPERTEDDKIWNLVLDVKIDGYDERYKIDYIVDFTKTEEVSLSGETIEKEVKEIETIDPDQILSFHDVPELDIDYNFLKGSPPVTVKPNVVIPAEGVEITLLEYLPPKDVDSKRAIFRVEYKVEGEKRKQSKLIGFQYSTSIREATDETINTITSADFRFLQKDRTVIPAKITVDDFEYNGDIKGLEIVGVEYNFNAVDMDWRFITASIIVELKTINYRIEKILEFTYSKRDYVQGTFREVRQESSSIKIPSSMLKPDFLEKLKNKDKKAMLDLVASSTISKNYPYSKIISITLTRFFHDSNIVIFTIEALEQRGNLAVVHVFEKTEDLNKTYNEMLLSEIKPEDIIVKQDALPMAPTVDIDMRAFILPKYAKLNAIQFSKPNRYDRTMKVQLKLKSGKVFKSVEKALTFQMSEDEFILHQRDLWEKDYLMKINPSELSINIDTNGPPVDNIYPEDIFGIPGGVDVKVKYTKPPFGRDDTRVYVMMTRGNSRVTFEQTLIFNRGKEQ